MGDHIRKRRLDLGLWQKDVAATFGVTVSAVTNWELNRVTPYFTYLPKIIAFLGYTPPPYDKKTDDIVEKMKLYRLTQGLSQKKFAKLLRVNETTVAKWERGEHKPSKKPIKFSHDLSALELSGRRRRASLKNSGLRRSEIRRNGDPSPVNVNVSGKNVRPAAVETPRDNQSIRR